MCSEGRSKFFGFLKIIFLGLIIIQFIPLVISNVKENYQEMLHPKQHIGHLKITGVIANATSLIKKIRAFEKDPEIKALFLRIDSPGGFPGSAQMIFNELKKFGEKKPIVALVENICASAAYYIAASAHKIIASPSSLVGSIGTVAQIPNVKALLDKFDVKVYHVQSGKYKTSGSPVKEISYEELDYLKNIADDTYLQFIHDISVTRNIEKNDYLAWADGKIFTGNQALKLRLIDNIGSYSDALDMIKFLTKDPEEIKLVSLKSKSFSLINFLTGDTADYGFKSLASSIAHTCKTIITECKNQLLHEQTVVVN